MIYDLVEISDVTFNLDSKRVPLNAQQRKKMESNPIYPYYGANNILGYIDDYIFDEKILCVAEDGGNWGFGEKCAYIVNERCWVNNHAHVLTAKSNLHLEYLCYYLNYTDLSLHITGATRGKLNKGVLNKIKIPFPPLKTQKHIAQILDDAAELRDKTKQLLTEYDLLAQSIFLDMFGDPVINPKKWEKYKMNEVCMKVTDGTHDTPERLKKGIKFITGKHIRPYKIDYENSDYVNKEVHKIIYNRCNPEFNDVLYTNIGANLGTAALNIVDYEFSMKNVALLKCNKEFILGRYLEYYLNCKSMKEKIIWLSSIGGAQKFLSLSQLRKLKVLIPPIELQNQFAEKIALIEQQKELTKQELKESEDLFNCLLQKAFKGELVEL